MEEVRAGAGLGAADHPLLGAAVSLADGDGFLLTGRLSTQATAGCEQGGQQKPQQ